MKANEIQIGDWVHYQADLGKDGVYEEDIQVKNIYGDEINCEVRHYEIISGKRLCDCKPIPLTPDILENNGFEKVYDKYKLPNYRIKWNSYTGLYFTVFTGVDGYWNPIGLNVITGGIPATVDYVHQLQHALRLCEINKTIEL